MIRLVAFLLLAVAGSPAAAQHAEPNCPAEAAPVPAELAGWANRAPLAAATDSAGLAAAVLVPGKAVELALRPTPEVRYALAPERPGEPASHGGMAAFTVPAAGKWRVALGSAAWIDVVRDGTAATSVAHGHGPACSGIRKMVDFALEPGSYVLQIAGSAAPTVAVLVTPLP